MSRNAPQQTPNVLTPSSINAATATGFSQGDLVFYKGSTGSYVAPSDLTAPATTQFTYSPTVAVSGGNAGGVVSSAFADTASLSRGGARNRFAAVLTNGNIVQVYGSSYIPCFRIIDSSGALVVAQTTITATYTMSSDDISVVALTGGGFAVVWINTSGGTVNIINYAVYSNTGSVVTGATNDTTCPAGSNGYGFNCVALSGGGFAVTYFTTAKILYYRGYSATGVGAYGWSTTSLTCNSFNSYPALAARNDGSFVLLAFTTNYQWRVINSGGGVTASGSISATGYYNTLDATCLSDGQTIVFAYYSTTSSFYLPRLALLPASNVIGSEILAAPSTNQNIATTSTSRATYFCLLGLASGNFVFLWPDAYGQTQYAFYNSSGTAISGTNVNGTLPKQFPSLVNALYCRVTAIEFGGKVNLYWRGNCANYGNITPDMVTGAISTSTYLPVLLSSTTQQLTTVSSATGSLYTAGVTPTKAQYYAANTETLPVSLPTAYTATPSVVVPSGCVCVSSTTLPNGQILIAYIETATYAINVAVYSINGVYQQTISIGTSYAVGTAGYNSMRITALSSGKFAIAYYSTATRITTAVYSSAFALINSAVAFSTTDTYSTSKGLALTALSTDRFIVGCMVANAMTIQVMGSANEVIYLYSPGASAHTSPCLAADKFGGFCMTFYDGGATTWYSYFFYQYGPTNYSTTGSVATGGAFTYNGAYTIGAPGGGYILPNTSSATVFKLIAYDAFGSQYGNTSSDNTVSNTNNYTLGLTGAGSVVFANLTTSSAVLTNVWPQISTQANTSMATTVPSANTFTLTGYSGGATSTSPSLSPGYGDNVVLTWLDGSTFPTFAIINMTPSATNTTVTSGVTLSNNIPIVPYTSPSANSISNAVLMGVAASTATAGTVGVVQTNGTATLNSNYSASTAAQGFDHQSPNGTGISGVKGTIYGRNVIMQGNN